ncbi:ADP-ribose pyrophosphatase [Thermomonospora echinospora]|uniref:ADP-ribose pyrophosphatase n=1 Tax=Thermomonospora echinospora TaxID=1992 RepID=A0A1H6DVX6_9ACTN|nr:NUDIX hydrolase [Thermomonospora echinospora]SEG89408.1 ADP-ribose pyrophosphatase [Thermomonospora echinospora]
MDSPDQHVEKIVAERLLYTGRTIKVFELKVETKPGVYENLEIVEKAGDSVAILPVDDSGNVHIIKEYYAAADSRLYSLPKGTIEAGESPQEAARREMQEEVGLAGDLTPLAVFDLSPGYLRQRTSIFLARNLRHVPVGGDEVTFIAPVSIPYDQAIAMALSGEITEARLVAALFLAQPHLKRARALPSKIE